MVELIGAIDQGTQSSRFVLYDESATVVAKHQQETKQIYPKPGWCEQDPWDIFKSVEVCISSALKKAQEKYGDVVVKGIGITNQRETTIAWDRNTGEPLHNAIVWHDLRTADVVKEMVEKLGDRNAFRKITGLPLSTYFSAVKMVWLMDKVPAVKQAVNDGTCCFGTVDSWLIYNLTGGSANGGKHVSDVTNASRYLLMDLNTLEWDGEIAAKFGIPVSALPKIVSNSELYGKVAHGVLEGTPICGCIGDQQAATLGQKCRPGEAKNTYGTGLFLLLNTGESIVQSSHGLLTTISFKLGATETTQYALEGAVATGGSAVTWLRDGIGIIDNPEESEKHACSVESTGGVYFVPAFSGLLAPYWQEDARGVIIGLTQYSTKSHIVRATLESLCFQSRDVLDAMVEDYGKPMLTLRVDGGASANAFLLQFQSDILGIDIVRPVDVESTCRGAALAAGMHLGVWTKEQIFSAEIAESDTVFKPAMAEQERQEKYEKWKDAVRRSFDWSTTKQ